MDIFYTQKHLLHDTTAVKVRNALYQTEEIPNRAERICHAVEQANLGPLTSPEDFGGDPILAVHSAEMVEFLRTASLRMSAEYGSNAPIFPEIAPIRHVLYPSTHPVAQAGIFCYGTDSPILEGTWEASYWSAQCALSGAKRLLDGSHASYALCRPPGHHAMSSAYGGFCYLNNAGIAAQYLQNAGANTNIAILDIDYHHGNGTQEIFYRDPQVLFCSLHADPEHDYPYFWGGAAEIGEGAGEGFNRNWPLPLSCPGDEYFAALFKSLETIANYAPKFLVVSLGLDIVAGDPVGSFDITPDDVAQIGAGIASLDIATLIVQEGGYRLETLGQSTVAFLGNFAT